ncbi:MAG: D-aminoacyl-tRNA deacylase, partial [Thermoplasmata archaeon]|nr:D-aminoacyl-tRNA deacylase [Thermoplasmata archaeon]
ARTLLALGPADHPVALGVGGGHYVPRLTDVALGRQVSFGHMIPTYALDTLSEPVFRDAISRTPGAGLAYVHRKAIRNPNRERVMRWIHDAGLKVIRERDLGPLEDGPGGKGL